MAVYDVAGGRVYHVWDIPREFLGHNLVSGLCTLKPKKPVKKLKTFSKKPMFFWPFSFLDVYWLQFSPVALHYPL